ncbi:MAG: tetratricopeptide repeat protein [Verrucomicrobiota bacterium]
MLLELLLRLVGYGYPTAFLLKKKQGGRDVFVQNNQFGWRFFGREMARWPYPFTIPQSKTTNTVRILVFGESAARGEPQPDFGMPRVLQALLSGKYPDTRFEVVNVAMTAINSHVILPIAQDCASLRGDIWVIYMGNNEVVGPFGAGTVFGPQTPPLPLIRASLAVKTTRTGQLLDAIQHWIQKSPRDDGVWGGMTLFLDQQVRSDDPRMNGVYHHFQNNLEGIIQAGRRSGAGIVVSTVAVNVRDCPPFASAHRRELSETDRATWDRLYQLGVAAQEAGNNEMAAVHFQAAAELDDTFAELRFRQGECALALGKAQEAGRHFQAARDQDTLRFRCDSKLNELIRSSVRNWPPEHVLFADAESAFAGQSHGNLPGKELFYEHVHLTFDGNYLLAKTLAEQVAKLLPGWATRGNLNNPWPPAEACARRLARTDWNEVSALNSIVATINEPPFTGQIHHQAQMHRMEAWLSRLSLALQPDGLRDAQKVCEAALQAAPDDAALHKQLALLKRASGDLTGAAVAAKRELDLLPNDSEGWALLGSILAGQQLLDEAAVAFHRAFQLGPQGIKSSLDLAGALAALGRYQEAADEYQHILKLKPHCVPALLQLGQLWEKNGRKSEAESCFQQAFAARSQRLPELMELGNFFQTRGNFNVASTIYTEAIRFNPTDPMLQLAAGRNLASLGRYGEAGIHSAEAVRLVPRSAEARLMHGIVLWKRGMTEQAKGEFQEALRLNPESLDARLNLGIVLAQQKKNAEALSFFEQVLQRSPTNALALKYAQSLRSH